MGRPRAGSDAGRDAAAGDADPPHGQGPVPALPVGVTAGSTPSTRAATMPAWRRGAVHTAESHSPKPLDAGSVIGRARTAARAATSATASPSTSGTAAWTAR